MSQPTRQEIIRAHEALSDLTYLADKYITSTLGGLDETRKLRQSILAALPPKPQPTMAEVEWDDDKHYLAEAEHVDWGKVVMLYYDGQSNRKQAGLLATALPVPDRYMSPPRGAVWYLLGPIGDIRCTGETIVAYGMDFRRQSFRLVMSKEETETLALTLLAAARSQEEA